MSTPIKTNQIVYEKINYSNFNKKYDVFVVKTKEKHFRTGAYIIDAPVLDKNVCAVQFETGNRFYIMMYRNPDNKRRLHDAVSGAEGAEFITVSRITSSELDDRIILQLLLNSLASVENSEISFNNITGHFYCFRKDWINKSKKDNTVFQIKCLEIGISPDYRLQFDVRTFTSVRLKNKIKFDKKKFSEYPQYVMSAHKTLRRKLETDTDIPFIMRQKDGERNNIDFMDFRNIKVFEKSKIGVVSAVLLKFNEKFSDITKIDFRSISDYNPVTCMRHDREPDIKFINKKLQSQKIYIVDKINDEYSTEFCTRLKEMLFKEYNIQAEIRKRIVKNGLNLCFIHNAEYYTENNQKDPHKQIYYFFMTVRPDGTFEFDKPEFTMFEESRYSECIKIFEDNPETVKGVIRDGYGNINIIRDTHLVTMPEIFRIHQELENDNTAIKNELKREELFPSVINIKQFRLDDSIYYFAGIVGKSLDGMSTAVNIRRIEIYEDSEELFSGFNKITEKAEFFPVNSAFFLNYICLS